ncbi:hypothetical protein H4R18_003864 [Coemansia javaensis]|uniref:NADH-ubiquinone oxidoreductase 21kDa subunit N-terminal domain-containing protein n=1 Tax=Coemansia javaensis TaxID=2761396 RepID=A0A9W8H989_9FUNG|nr:hypothetical protein H4R18_003864 [Coemansia javaensis]
MRPLHEAPYPIIDTDPLFSRVVRYMRPVDYLVWAGTAMVGPAVVFLTEKYMPPGQGRIRYMRDMKVVTLLTTALGFMNGYASSCTRFWGLRENSREIKMYRQEYARLKAQGKPMHGTSTLPLSIQRTAAGYSTGAFLAFDMFPIFNFVDHPFHGQSEGVIPEDEK